MVAATYLLVTIFVTNSTNAKISFYIILARSKVGNQSVSRFGRFGEALEIDIVILQIKVAYSFERAISP